MLSYRYPAFQVDSRMYVFLGCCIFFSRHIADMVDPIRTRSENDQVLPLSAPITGRDGREVHELFIPAGTLLVVNNVGINYDRSLWGADAHAWRPERWLEPLPESVAAARYPCVYSHMCVSS